MKHNFKALIVDDERLARKELRSMLSSYDTIKIVGEAENVATAIEAIEQTRPDVIFLDIQMPGKSGFDLLKENNINAHIIFVTAFDEYAIRAFEVNALDYLLKPITPERLQNAVNRLSTKKTGEENLQRKLKYTDRLFLSVNSRMQFLKINTILCISAAGDYSEIMTTSEKNKLILKSLKEWESRLPEKYFCRIHRSTIINMEFIDKIEEQINHSYQVYLKGIANPYPISRRCASKLKDKFG